VGSLFDCLVGINRGLADNDILDKYSEVRIKLWRELIDPTSRANFHRLWDAGAESERTAHLERCRILTENPEVAQQSTSVSSQFSLLLYLLF